MLLQTGVTFLSLDQEGCSVRLDSSLSASLGAAEAAFDKIPSVGFPQLCKEFLLEMDASGKGLGAVRRKSKRMAPLDRLHMPPIPWNRVRRIME